MDEEEFGRLLDLFPIVRPRDYHIDSDPSRQSASQPMQDQAIDSDPSRQSASQPMQDQAVNEWQDEWEEGDKKEISNQAIDINDAFWEKLKLAAENKMGAEEAKRFCEAFQQVHQKLVSEELSLDAAQRFINLSKSYGQ